MVGERAGDEVGADERRSDERHRVGAAVVGVDDRLQLDGGLALVRARAAHPDRRGDGVEQPAGRRRQRRR